MTVREIFISLGFKIDPNTEKKVNNGVDALKQSASDLLDNIGVSFEVDKDSKAAAAESAEQLSKHATEQIKGIPPIKPKVDPRSESEAINRMKQLRSMAFKILGVIGIGLTLGSLRRITEEFGGVNDQLRNATREMGDQRDIQQHVLRAANDTRQTYDQMANTIGRLAQSGLFQDIESAAYFATLMYQDFAAAGVSGKQAAYVSRYMMMDLQRGEVSSRTINAMFRDSPHLIDTMSRRLNVSVQELQEMAKAGTISADILKSVYFESAEEIRKRFGETTMTITDAMTNVRNQWGMFVNQINDDLGITQVIARTIVDLFGRFLNVLRRVSNMFMSFANRVGGVNNLLRLMAIMAAGLFAAFKGRKILGFFRSLNRAMLKSMAKFLLIIAVVVALALLVDDFIAFMRGDDSMIGVWLERFGISADDVREKIINLRERVKEVFSLIWQAVKPVLEMIVENLDLVVLGIFALIAAFGAIKAILGFVKVIKVVIKVFKFLKPVFNFVAKIVKLVARGFKALKAVFKAILPVIKIVIKVIKGIIAVFSAKIIAIIAVIAFLVGLVIAIVRHWSTIVAIFRQIWDAVVEAFRTAAGFISDIVRAIIGFFIDLWERIKGIWDKFKGFLAGLWDGIKTTVGNIVNTISEGIGRAIDWITSLPAKAVEWGRNLIQGFIDGILGMVNRVKDAVSGVVGRVASFLGFNSPAEEGEGRYVVEWGYNMISGFLDGVSLGYSAIDKSLGGITSFLANDLGKFKAGGYEKSAYSYITNKIINVYMDMHNEFNGSRSDQKTDSEFADRATDDITGGIERALQFVR